MKVYRLLLLLPFFFFACNEDQTTRSTADTVAPAKVKDTIVTTAAANDSLKPDRTKDSVLPDKGALPKITGEVYFNRSYCGGMVPTAEMLEDLKKYRQLVSSVIVLKNGKARFEISTDGKGHFYARLPYGEYKVYVTRKTKGCEYKSADAFQIVTGTVTLKAGDGNKIYFTIPCDISERMRP